MTGMKEGAGEDPFAEEPESSTAESEVESTPEEDESAETKSPAEVIEEMQNEDEQESSQQPQEPMQIPYKLRRDGVQDGRDRVPLFLQSETKSDERNALRELEERFDEDVSLTDLREALVMAGLDHLDEVEIHLEQWGYGMTFDN